MDPLKPKKKDYGLEIKTFKGETGNSYLVHRTQEGSLQVFVEVEAKSAALDCRASGSGNTRSQWEELWSS
jgi:hypothetical protein